MKIKIISVGKTKKGYIYQGIQEYLSRLRYYTSIEWIEIPPSKKSKGSSFEEGIRQEADKVRLKCHPHALKVVLAEEGKGFDSIEFSKWIEQNMIEGRREIDFIIGGDFGLDPSIISGSDLSLSLSRFTFTHQMARLILLEQLYRAFTIIRGEPYHHE